MLALLSRFWRWIVGAFAVVLVLLALLVWPGFLTDGNAQNTPTATPTLTPTFTPTLRPTWTPTPRPTATPRPDNTGIEQRVSKLEAQMEEILEILRLMAAGQATQPAQTPAPRTEGTQTVPQGGQWTPATKCSWLRENFPQSAGAVQSMIARLAGVPENRIAPHLYPCSGTETVYDGGIILGPAEDWTTPFTVNVTTGGAVDSYPGAVFTGSTRQIGQETIRAYSGSVTTLRATVWAFDDDNPPTGGLSLQLAQPTVAVTAVPTTVSPTATPRPQPTAVPTSEQISCVHPQELASQLGWREDGWADQKYGGLRVILSTSSTLPNMWEAISDGKTIREMDADRAMNPGTWSIYPPYQCREVLGYSK